VKVEAVQNGKVVATTKADDNGRFAFPDLTTGAYQLRLPASDFAAPYGGISWLGRNLITPAIIIAYLWIYAGFAMVLLAAGMAAIPREALEAARIDGATEWQVFRRITAPLLAPVMVVVFVTLVINVLKVFDIVFVMEQGAGGSGKYADVLAVSLYQAFGNQNYGLASAIGVLLVLLVIPAMAFNIRRFRREQT
jgi:alpha-glucoside transport system permease protein